MDQQSLKHLSMNNNYYLKINIMNTKTRINISTINY